MSDEMLKLHMEQDKERFDSIDAKLDMLIEAHNKQRGFIAGFSAAFSVLAATVVALAGYIWKQVGG